MYMYIVLAANKEFEFQFEFVKSENVRKWSLVLSNFRKDCIKFMSWTRKRIAFRARICQLYL